MKVILLKDIAGIGRKGDVKDVAEGYAQNFLLPRKMGVVATEKEVARLKIERSRDEEERKIQEIADYRSPIGRGMRAEKIRTYNYPQDRITDHRIGKSWGNLESIVDGNLDKVIEATKNL